ncbi:hypothetical protein [Clostridium tagluense]|nr:hypothetical protein [Clostridium tagluense]
MIYNFGFSEMRQEEAMFQVIEEEQEQSILTNEEIKKLLMSI